MVREQADILQQRYDVRVLHGIKHAIKLWPALRYFHFLPGPGITKVWPMEEGLIPTPPPVTSFNYIHRSPNEQAEWAATIDAYRQMLAQLISVGWKPDIIHAQSAEIAGIIAAALAREFDIPWVLTENQVFILSSYSEHRRRLMVDAINSATRVLAVSYHQMRAILSHGIERPIQVVGNLIDEEQFRFAEPRKDPDNFRILTVTYPYPIKDPETFFRAIAILMARNHQDITATVIGNDSWGEVDKANSNEFAALAEKHGVGQVCRFIPYVSRADMPAQYAECDVFVSTSIAETYGIAVREAMAVGRPVVCTASGGVEDDLTPETGIKVNITDAEGLADALVAIKTGTSSFEPRKIRDLIISRHGRQAFLDQMSVIYDEVLQNNTMRL